MKQNIYLEIKKNIIESCLGTEVGARVRIWEWELVFLFYKEIEGIKNTFRGRYLREEKDVSFVTEKF